jgi:phage recombination protein Bet
MTDALVVWTQEQKELIKKTVATDATDAELAMFLHIAAKAGLDPLQKQIHFTKRNGKVTVIADISGLQARAARNADFRGSLFAAVHAKDDFEYDATIGKVVKHAFNAFGDRGPIKGAWATVEREGKLPFTALVRFEEFNQPQSPTWRQMPSVMITKVARSTALRQAYPEQFGGIYERAEMDQAGPSDTEKVAERDITPKSGPEAVRAALAAPAVPATVHALPAPATLQSALQASVLTYQKRPISELTVPELQEGAAKLREWLDNPRNKTKRDEVQRTLEAMQAEATYRETDSMGSDALPPDDMVLPGEVSP